MGICIICRELVPDERGHKMTCCDEHENELRSRQEIAEHKRRMERRLARLTQPSPPKKTLAEIAQTVVEDFARVLLDKDIPYFISNAVIDDEICKNDAWFKGMDVAYRRRCLSKNLGFVGYTVYSAAGRGNHTFGLAEDRDVLRERLEKITSGSVKIA